MKVVNREISRVRNGLQVDGRQETYNGAQVNVYLKDDVGNIVLGKDTNGSYFGTAFNKQTAAVTASTDGLTTGLIPTNVKFVTVTSAGATKIATLPAISAATIGQSIEVYVGANGYTLETPAASNNTINAVDADGTNQLDVAANSVTRLIQITATGWLAFQQTASALSVVAPDND